MSTETPTPRAIASLWMVVPLLCGLAGCSGKYATQSVEGTLTDNAGTPLPNVMIVFERSVEPLVARGITDENGRFRLGTTRPDEGAPVGAYRVCMSQQQQGDPDKPAPRRFAKRYDSPETSGFEVEIVPGRNQFDFKLDPPE